MKSIRPVSGKPSESVMGHGEKQREGGCRKGEPEPHAKQTRDLLLDSGASGAHAAQSEPLQQLVFAVMHQFGVVRGAVVVAHQVQ